MRGEGIKPREEGLKQFMNWGEKRRMGATKLSSWTEEGEGTRKLRKKERKEGRKRRSSQNLHCCKVEGLRT